MFAGGTFAGIYFAGLLETVTPPTPVATSEKGWPFGRDLAVPRASRVPRFDPVRVIVADDEELVDLVNLWLNSRR